MRISSDAEMRLRKEKRWLMKIEKGQRDGKVYVEAREFSDRERPDEIARMPSGKIR